MAALWTGDGQFHEYDNPIHNSDCFPAPVLYPNSRLSRRAVVHLAGFLMVGAVSPAQVRELLGLSDQRRRSCEAVDAVAREHLAEVDRKIADLEALRRELARIISQCGHGTVAECRIIVALSPASTLDAR